MDHRIFVEWEQGGYVSSLDPDFQQHLVEMVEQFGPPSNVEFRAHGEGWAPPSPPCEKCGKGIVECHCDETQCPKCDEWHSCESCPFCEEA